MKLIFEPTVYLIGRQQIVDAELKRFLDDSGVPNWTTEANSAAEIIPEIAGRLCYMSYGSPRPGGNHKYLEHIKEVGHGSVTEHGGWNMIITGVSRSLTHEIVRHRTGTGFSQLSQRYVDESIAEYVVPPALRDEVNFAISANWGHEEALRFTPEQKAMEISGSNWVNSIEDSHNSYVRAVEYQFNKFTKGVDLKDLPFEERTSIRKRARESARSLLPNATETKLFLTINARSARNFLELRASKHADAEIRMLANRIFDVLIREAPALFDDYQKEQLPDGTFELTTKFKKI